jgi:hypothetical protein
VHGRPVATLNIFSSLPNSLLRWCELGVWPGIDIASKISPNFVGFSTRMQPWLTARFSCAYSRFPGVSYR